MPHRAKAPNSQSRASSAKRVGVRAERGQARSASIAVTQLPSIVERLLACVRELEGHFPGRRFTLDGHLVGSLGEVWAQDRYGLQLFPGSTRRHDAQGPDGRLVQIKATQRNNIGLSGDKPPGHLLVLKLKPEGMFEEVFNGPGSLAWEIAGPKQKNGQHQVSVRKIGALITRVRDEQRIRRIRTE